MTERLHFHFSLSCIGGNGNPLQCSCLENPRDGGAWCTAVSGVAQSRTRLKRLSSSRAFFKTQDCLVEETNRDKKNCLRPYHPERARSRLISEAKQGRAWLVLGWEIRKIYCTKCPVMRWLKMSFLIPFASGKAIENSQKSCGLAWHLKKAEPGKEDDRVESAGKRGQKM